MADTYTLANFLQGRNLSRESARQPIGPYTAPLSEFTTPGDRQRERISNTFGWDVGPGGWDPGYALQEFGRRALTQLPLAARTPGAARATAAPAAPQGPWTPGYLDQWLANRSPAPPVIDPVASPPTLAQRGRAIGRGISDRVDDAFPGALRLAKQVAPYNAGAVGGVGGGYS